MFQILLMKFHEASIFLMRSARLGPGAEPFEKEPTKGIGTVFLDHIHWVDTATREICGSLLITDKAVDKHVLERLTTSEFQ